MANNKYDVATRLAWTQQINLLTDDMRVVLLSNSYVFDKTHTSLTPLRTYIVGTPVQLANKTIASTGTVFDSDNAVYAAGNPPAGTDVYKAVIYRHTGTDSTAVPCFYYDTLVGLPFTDSGGTSTIDTPSGWNTL